MEERDPPELPPPSTTSFAEKVAHTLKRRVKEKRGDDGEEVSFLPRRVSCRRLRLRITREGGENMEGGKKRLRK